MAIVKCYDRKRDVTYVYESECFYDEEKGKYRYRRRLIGKIDPETGETVPTGPHGGARQKKEHKPPEGEEWIPLKPGRKKKNAAGDSGAAFEEKDELQEAKETIRILKSENARLKREYSTVVNKYNSLADALRRITPEHMQE